MSTAAVELFPVGDTRTRDAARHLIAEYLRWIAASAAANYGLSFDVDAMVASDVDGQSKFYPPSGRFYVVRHSNAYIGVGCLKRLTPTVAEVQRMYVQPHVRRIGAGRRVVGQLFVAAPALRYAVVRHERLKILFGALRVYKVVGFVRINPDAEDGL